MLGRIRVQFYVRGRFKKKIMNVFVNQCSVFFEPIAKPDINLSEIVKQAHLIYSKLLHRFARGRLWKFLPAFYVPFWKRPLAVRI